MRNYRDIVALVREHQPSALGPMREVVVSTLETLNQIKSASTATSRRDGRQAMIDVYIGESLRDLKCIDEAIMMSLLRAPKSLLTSAPIDYTIFADGQISE